MRPSRLRPARACAALIATSMAASSLAFSSPERSVTLTSGETTLTVWGLENGVVLNTLRRKGTGPSWAATGGKGVELVTDVTVDGSPAKLTWRLLGVDKGGDGATFRYQADRFGLLATSVWSTAGGTGPIEHTLSIINHGEHAVTLPLQSSLNWSFNRPPKRILEAWWVEKAAGRPSPIGVHTSVIDGDYAHTVTCEPYEVDKRAYSTDWRDRDAIPWISVWDRDAHEGWYAGIEFTGRVSLRLHPDGKNRVGVGLGISDEDLGAPSFTTIVQPGETYALPTVFVGCYRGQVEDGSNQLTRWVASHLRPKTNETRLPLLNQNSWGSDMAINADLASSMMQTAAKLGVEQFHIDAGWYRAVGDWRANPTKFPNGMNAVADEAHALGLKFGLWVGWSQGGIQPDGEDPLHVLNVFNPARKDWFAQRYASDWKPSDYTGANLCLSDPDASKWCIDLLTAVVKENHVDMLEHDQQMIVEDCAQSNHPHTASRGDIAYRATLGYYAVYDAMRSRFPNLLFENCVNGGRNVDYGTARRATYFSIVDSYDPLSNRQAIYDISYVMPVSMCECYVMAMPVKTIPEFRHMLRSGLMGWCSIMQDPSKWSAEQKAAAKEEFDRYKTTVRPLIQDGNVFHVSERPNGIRWDGMEYASRKGDRAVLFAYRGTTAEVSHTYPVRGLNPRGHYRLHEVDGGRADRVAKGQDLMRNGIEVRLTAPGTSQMVVLTQE